MRYNFWVLPGERGKSAMPLRLSKPIRTVLAWQLAVAVAICIAAAFLAGKHGAISAAAGGAVSLVAGLVSALVASGRAAKSAGGMLVVALKAEAVKLGLALILLWLVLANYDDAVSGALLVSFVATMLVFSMAFFVRDES
jgi:ATP synthase protein I